MERFLKYSQNLEMIRKFKFFNGIMENVYVATFNGDLSTFRNTWNGIAIRAMSLYRNNNPCVDLNNANTISTEERIIKLLDEMIDENRA